MKNQPRRYSPGPVSRPLASTLCPAALAPTEAPAPRLVILESPFAGSPETRERNVAYARDAMAECLRMREAPFASHLLYTQPGVLDDDKPDERLAGIDAGLAWGRMAERTVVYTDLGISAGMRLGIARAQAQGRPVEYRSLAKWAKFARDAARDEIRRGLEA